MKIKKIILHHSATPQKMDIGVDEIRRWHVDGNGWRDIGYHYVIRRDGTIEKGRADDEPGAHARGHNMGSLGVCLVGNGSFAISQWCALKSLLTVLMVQHEGADIIGHCDVGNTDCPGFDVAEIVASHI